MLPIMVISVFSAIVLMLALLQVGSAHVLERQAETASDAAALAAAEAYASVINASPLPNYAAAAALAAGRAPLLATANDATMVGYQTTGIGPNWRVTVSVETDEGVVSGLVGAVAGDQAGSTSTARVVLTPGGTATMTARLVPNP